MSSHFVLNINSCVVCPRTSATDENPIIFRRIDDETARMIDSGKVKASVVIEALEKKERSASDFNWKEYDKKRQAAEKALNVSQRDMIPVSDPNAEDGRGKDDDADVVSLKDLDLVDKKKPNPNTPKESKEKKPKANAEILNSEDSVNY